MMKRFTNQSNGSQAGRMYNGGAIIRRFALFPLMLLMLLLLPAGMVAQKAGGESVTSTPQEGNVGEQAYAVFDKKSYTLTFCYGTKPEGAYNLNEGNEEPEWDRIKGVFLKKVVFDASFANARPTSCSKWFSAASELVQIEGIENLNTENVTKMDSMFTDCVKLNSVDVTKFNTEKVTDMRSMFDGCKSLLSLDVTSFNTKNVTNMNSMFYACVQLTSLDVTKFNTENVTDMKSMFCSCKNITWLDLSNFNTKNVTYMSWMFAYCSALKTIYASNEFVITKVSDGHFMFADCFSLKGEREWSRFNDHSAFARLKDGYFTSKDAYPWVKYADGTLTFYNSYKDALGENEYELNSGANLPGWAKHKKEITKVVFDTSFANAKPTSCYAWFQDFRNLTQIEGIKNLNTEKVTDMSSMFYNCPYLFLLDVSGFNTDNVTNMQGMFGWCSALASLNVTNFNTENVTNMKAMFSTCRSLTSLDVTNFNTENVTDMSKMFEDCSKLTSLDVTNFNTINVTNMENMFCYCGKLTLLDVTNFNTVSVTNMRNMFGGSSALRTIYVSDKFVINNKNYSLFHGCEKLKGAIDKYDNSKIDGTYANYKTGYFTKLVGKNGDEKIGATGETLATDNLTLDDDKDFVAYEPFAAKAASYSRPVKEGTTWATLCLPFEVSLDDQNFRAFKLLSADDVTGTVELEEIKTRIEAGTPVIIKMNDGATKLDFTEANKEIAKDVQTAETANGNYQLQGIYTQKEFSKDTDNNCYIVKGAKLMNPAKLLDKTATKSVGSKPFRAYMADNSSAPAAGARMFSISVGGSTTAIEQLETTADSKAEYYDLQGHRLQNLQKGVNIVKRGGKTMKVIIK